MGNLISRRRICSDFQDIPCMADRDTKACCPFFSDHFHEGGNVVS
jgi:hypothetical protein